VTEEEQKQLLEGSIATAFTGKAIVFNPELAAAQPQTTFKYGWCHTDHKEGKEIRTDFRKIDFMKDKPYAALVKKSLQKLGLPMPEKGEVFRGTHHDLLFLDSHGVVIRIGPLDVKDLMNPAIIQPLGWFEFKDKVTVDVKKNDKVPFTIAIYPGIELYKDFNRSEKKDELEKTDLRAFLSATGQGDRDMSSSNRGIIRVFDEENNKEVAVEMLLDPDNQFNGSTEGLTAKRSKALSNSTGTSTEESNFAEVVSRALTSIFSAASDIKWYQKAFETHEPLRRLFWKSFKGKAEDEQPDAACMKLFWDTCARVTNNPASCTMPVWKAVEKDGETTFVREEAYMPHVILYRPWTGQHNDKFIPPIGKDAQKVEALRQAHVNEFLYKPWKDYLKEELHHGENNWQILAGRIRDAREEAERLKQKGIRLWNQHLEHELHLGENNWAPHAVPDKAFGKLAEGILFVNEHQWHMHDRYYMEHLRKEQLRFSDYIAPVLPWMKDFRLPDVDLLKKLFGRKKQVPEGEDKKNDVQAEKPILINDTGRERIKKDARDFFFKNLK
jgi:hypothetical protein